MFKYLSKESDAADVTLLLATFLIASEICVFGIRAQMPAAQQYVFVRLIVNVMVSSAGLLELVAGIVVLMFHGATHGSDRQQNWKQVKPQEDVWAMQKHRPSTSNSLGRFFRRGTIFARSFNQLLHGRLRRSLP